MLCGGDSDRCAEVEQQCCTSITQAAGPQGASGPDPSQSDVELALNGRSWSETVRDGRLTSFYCKIFGTVIIFQFFCFLGLQLLPILSLMRGF